MFVIRRLSLLLVVALPLVMVACSSRPDRVEMPGLDPSAISAAAIQQYDTDGDGALSQVELAKCPGILKAVKMYDKNSDGSVTADEIADRINSWIEFKTASMSVSCYVTLDGKPLDGGKIEFVPEECFGDSIIPAAGEISGGGANVFIDPSLLPPEEAGLLGVQPGVYKVKVTHPSIEIPAKYNTETTLGQEVAQDTPDYETMTFDLSSR